MKVGETMHLREPVRDATGRYHQRGDPVQVVRIQAHDASGEHPLALVRSMEPNVTVRATFYCYPNELEACTCEAGDAS